MDKKQVPGKLVRFKKWGKPNGSHEDRLVRADAEASHETSSHQEIPVIVREFSEESSENRHEDGE
jgi:hypothetical protein